MLTLRRDKSRGVRRLTRLSMLTAMALIIFIVELQIPNPLPLPGMKLGLANIITVYAVYRYRPWEVLGLVLVRVLLGAVFGGRIGALPFSLGGGLMCLAGMAVLCHFIDEDHIWIASVFGAVLHDLGQTAAAIAVTGTTAVLAYLPYLCLSGCIAGAFTGLTAQWIMKKMRRSGAEGRK